MASPSETSFERYDAEFSGLMRQIEASLEEQQQQQPNGNDDTFTASLVRQADDLIKQMAVEARGMGADHAALKRTMLDKVRSLKAELTILQTKYEKGGLFRVSSNNNNNKSDRDKLLMQQKRTDDMLSNQNETLERARRSMEETEQVALEISSELSANRETLMSAHGRVQQVSGLTGRAKRILSSMNQRAVQQKLVVYGVGVGLVLGFLVLLYTLWG